MSVEKYIKMGFGDLKTINTDEWKDATVQPITVEKMLKRSVVGEGHKQGYQGALAR